MKKLFLALLALPLLASITACSSDDSQPNVNINITYGNAKVVDNQVYVVKPDTFRIDRVDVTAVNPDKKAANGPVSYFLNAVPLGTNPVAPFGMYLTTADMEVGSYIVQMTMPIYEEGCELSTAFTQVKLNVVADSTDIPTAAVPSITQQVDYSFK